MYIFVFFVCSPGVGCGRREQTREAVPLALRKTCWTTCAEGGKPTRNGLEMSLGRLDVVGPDICVCPCFKKGVRF